MEKETETWLGQRCQVIPPPPEPTFVTNLTRDRVGVGGRNPTLGVGFGSDDPTVRTGSIPCSVWIWYVNGSSLREFLCKVGTLAASDWDEVRLTKAMGATC